MDKRITLTQEQYNRNRSKNILICCERSGVVRQAFRKYGYNAWSCDILPSVDRSPYHIVVVTISPEYFGTILNRRWDFIGAHPPCDDLAVSGARWFPGKVSSGQQQKSIEFFMMFTNLSCPHVYIENPVGIMSKIYRKPDQYYQPWMFGHKEYKKTCLWLKGLPPLLETDNVKEETDKLPDRLKFRVHHMSPGSNRSFNRAITYTGVSNAMVTQWGLLL